MSVPGVPYRRLLAFAEAAPIKSVLGLERCTVELDEELGKHTLTEMEPRSHGASLAELTVIRDHAWRAPQPSRDIVDHLGVVARRHLVRAGPFYRLRTALDAHEPSHLNEPEAYAHWRWLSLLVPADILIASHAAEDGVRPAARRVDLGGGHLQLLFERGLTETHLHLGTAADASSAWADLAETLRTKSLSFAAGVGTQRRLRGVGAVDNLGALFISGQILRLLIARHVFVAPLPWSTSLPPRGRRRWADVHGALEATREVLAPVVGRGSAKHVVSAIVFLLRMGAPPPVGALQVALAALLSGWVPPRPDQVAARGAGIGDPLSAVFDVEEDAASHEVLLLFAALRTVREQRQLTLLHELVVQYLRIRTLHFSQLVHESGTSGLDAFRRYYQRTRTFLKADPSRRLLDAVSLCTPAGGRLRSLEVRTRPPNEVYEYVRLVNSLATAAVSRLHGRESMPAPEIGVVLHLVRSESGKRLMGLPGGRSSNARFQSWFVEQEIGITALERALDRWPKLMLMLRGIDVASAELGVPLWPTIDLVQRARRASERAAHKLALSGTRVPPFRLTYHAGEEFPHPLHGLRRIHELIEFGILEPGDRVGHGLALGVELGSWCRRGEPIICTRDDLLDDLLWEMDRNGGGSMLVDASRREMVFERARRELTVLFRDIPGFDLPHIVDVARELRRMRHAPAALRLVGYPSRVDRERASGTSSTQLVSWLTDPRVRARGKHPVELTFTEHDRRTCEALQRTLSVDLARMGVTVETNPSSNLLIGGGRALNEHPSFRLFPLSSSEAIGERVLISINSDNPLLCATSLPDEFAHMFAAILRHGESAEEAHRWLEAVAENGYRSRFTVPQSAQERWLRELGSLQ